MKINNKIINNSKELYDLIKIGINPMDYLTDIKDIESISKIITHPDDNYDPYFNDMAEILLKAIIIYIFEINDETKTLKKCLELINLELNNPNNERVLLPLFKSLSYDHPARLYYTTIEIAPEKTYKEICKNLSEKLSEIIIE